MKIDNSSLYAIKNKRAAKSLLLVLAMSGGLQAAQPVVYVDAARPDDSGDGASWETAKRTIQAAVGTVATNGTVLVTNGIYNSGLMPTPGGTLPNRVVATHAITIQSMNGPSETVIQGRGPVGANAVRGVYLSGGAKLIGFTIENGATLSSGHVELDVKGGAGFCIGGSLISNCVIRNNSAWTEGGGLRVVHNGNEVCNSTIESNKAFLAGGGVSLGDAAASVVRNCRIVGNQAGKGAGAFLYHSGVLESCLIAGNTASNHSGGVYADYGIDGPGGGGDAYIKNCTIAENSAPQFSAYGYVISGARVQNSIVQGGWGRVLEYWAGAVSFEYSVATPLPDGTGNTTNNPLFADAANGDFRLQIDSPCIDAGMNAYVTGSTDLDGAPRIFNDRVDMGAYEWTPVSYVITTTVEGNGSITPENPSVSQGQDQTFLIQPATGYHIASLTVDGYPVLTDSSYTFTNVQSAHSIEAMFAATAYSLSVENGSGSGSYAYQQQVTIAADAPAVGKEFDQWTGDTQYAADVLSSTTAVTMPTHPVTLTATYKDVYYALVITGGTGSGSCTYQQQVTIAADAPAVGMTFDRWIGDTGHVADVLSPATITTMPAQAVTLVATYKPVDIYTQPVNDWVIYEGKLKKQFIDSSDFDKPVFKKSTERLLLVVNTKKVQTNGLLIAWSQTEGSCCIAEVSLKIYAGSGIMDRHNRSLAAKNAIALSFHSDDRTSSVLLGTSTWAGRYNSLGDFRRDNLSANLKGRAIDKTSEEEGHGIGLLRYNQALSDSVSDKKTIQERNDAVKKFISGRTGVPVGNIDLTAIAE